MDNFGVRRRQNEQDKRLKVQETKPLGPTLGEFYSQWFSGPNLRGLWFPGVLDSSANMYDQSGQGRTLTRVGTPVLKMHNDLVPYMEFFAGTDRYFRADEAGISLIGSETFVDASIRGITMGAWVWDDDTPVSTEGYITQQDGTFAGSSYDLYTDASLNLVFNIFQPASLVQASGAGVIETGRWNFVVGRFLSGSKVDVLLNGEVVDSTATAVTATNNSVAQFCLGGYSGGGFELDGRIAVAFIAASFWPDILIKNQFGRSRTLFGV